MFTILYMFMSAVIPAMLMVVIMIAGGGITTHTAGVLYLLLLPFLLAYFLFMIKRFEPRL
jgi:hypothetical protein